MMALQEGWAGQRAMLEREVADERARSESLSERHAREMGEAQEAMQRLDHRHQTHLLELEQGYSAERTRLMRSIEGVRLEASNEARAAEAGRQAANEMREQYTQCRAQLEQVSMQLEAERVQRGKMEEWAKMAHERVRVYERRAEEAARQTQRTQESAVEALRVEANRAYEAQQQLAEVRGQQEAVEAAKMTAEAWANAGSRWMPTIMQHFPQQPVVVEKPPPPPKVARVEAPLSCPPELLHPVCSASTEAYGNVRNAAGVWLRESGLGLVEQALANSPHRHV